MKKTRLLKCLSLFLGVVLIAAMALTTSGCGQTKNTLTTATTTVPNAQKTVRGEGKTVFDFNVVDAEGKTVAFEIHTDKATVGEALIAEGLIEGHETEYGLYVDSVNGIALDWDKDGKYWAFYIDGEYAMTGVDTTEITEGATYAFKPE
jgi:ABC-type Fe3+-hydroxamate transport system substrate-binding protein